MKHFALVIAVFAGGCTGDLDDDGQLDTDAAPSNPDAAHPDAAPSNPDAAHPDAAPSNPDAGNGDSGAGEPAALVGMTALHNEVRAAVGVGPMTWDPDLAAIAQAWAEQCKDEEYPYGLIDHNWSAGATYPGLVGENVYGSSSFSDATPEDAVWLWAYEKNFYDYDSNTCSAVCGHYTQIVWADTVKLGCGIADCTELANRGTIVCNYAPGGNIKGQRPY